MADEDMKNFLGNFNKRFEEQWVKPTKKKEEPEVKPLFNSKEEDIKIPRFWELTKKKESDEETKEE
jgi:hypothetical protein